ncbi:MAG: KamA family radical SAM protein [Candidatus Woesearchaeota archaeon]
MIEGISSEKNIENFKAQLPEKEAQPNEKLKGNLEDLRWREADKASISKASELNREFPVNIKDVRAVARKYPMRINKYYLSLIKEKDDPVYKQCIPDIQELHDDDGSEDPLNEEEDSPVPGLTHRYPDRVLFLVSNQCAMYCRFCTRKRRVGDACKGITNEDIVKGIQYIRQHSEVRDVILSGGDPLLLSDDKLEFVLKELRQIPHVEIIRIGTRVPCTLPQRVTEKLCNMLKKYHPVYINTHFNHPAEITPESSRACQMLVDAGIPLGNQTVLMKGVNDDVETMKQLVHGLLKIRVKPYYLYLIDLVKGTRHFRTGIEKGIEIIKGLRGFTSGMAVPNLIVDSPGGGGKIPLLPDYFVGLDEEKEHVILKNYKGKVCEYPY